MDEAAIERMLQAHVRQAAEERLHDDLGNRYQHYLHRAAMRHYAVSCCAIALMLWGLWGVTPEVRATATNPCTLQQRHAALDTSEKIIQAL